MNYKESHPDYEELEISLYQKGRLRLVEPKTEYADIGLSWVRDQTAIQYMGADFSNPSIEKERERLQKIIDNTDEYSWMIELDGKVIGNVSIHSIKEKTEEFGQKAGNFKILIGDKNYWGQGIGYSVARAVLELAFRKNGFAVIFARALEQNIGSLKTLDKLGFEKIGTTPYEELVNGQPSIWLNFKLTKQKYLNF